MPIRSIAACSFPMKSSLLSFVQTCIRIALSPDGWPGIVAQGVHSVGPFLERRVIGKPEPPEFCRHYHSILIFDATRVSDNETRTDLVSEVNVRTNFSCQRVRIDGKVEDIEVHAAPP